MKFVFIWQFKFFFSLYSMQFRAKMSSSDGRWHIHSSNNEIVAVVLVLVVHTGRSGWIDATSTAQTIRQYVYANWLFSKLLLSSCHKIILIFISVKSLKNTRVFSLRLSSNIAVILGFVAFSPPFYSYPNRNNEFNN